MGDDQLPGVRRESTASRKTAFSDSGHRKPASIYEINDLYSALQELVNSSPRPLRRRRGTASNFDSSDSMTSGADSPDVRTKMQNDRKTMRVVRSASNIIRRYSGTESPSDTQMGRKLVRTPQLTQKQLSNQRPPIGGYQLNSSPKMMLKKSKSDVSRLRSRSSIESVKTMAEKIRDQRLKFTQGLKRRELEEKGLNIEGKEIKDIDDLVEWAKLDIGSSGKTKKKGHKKSGAKAKPTIASALSKIKPHCSDSNLKSLEATSRLDRWYEKASAIALGEVEDDRESYESYSGSDYDETAAKNGAKMKKGKSLDDIDLGLGCFTPDDLLDKWMKQKKNSLAAEERGRSASETSVEPVTPDESDSSMLSVGKDEDVQLDGFTPTDEHTSTPLSVSRIIVSQPSVDESKGKTDISEAIIGNLPNQPIFYIPNLRDDDESKTTIIYDDGQIDPLKVQRRPRSRSELNTGKSFDEHDEEVWNEIEKIAEKRSKSFGPLQRRASLETTMKKERKERLLSKGNDFQSQRPRSLILNSDAADESSRMGCNIKDIPNLQDREGRHIDANANICQRGKKHDKGKKLSKFPEKLKTLLSGKKV